MLSEKGKSEKKEKKINVFKYVFLLFTFDCNRLASFNDEDHDETEEPTESER